jgi:hypothetical protein
MSKQKQKTKGNVILINNVFVGDYGMDKNNLPHEVINFYRADSGNFYVYITPWGTVKKDINSENLKGIIFVRSVGNGLVEILGKADGKINVLVEGLNTAKDDEQMSSIIKNIPQQLKDVINKVTYGGCTIRDLYSENLIDKELFVSCEVERICLPKETYYLTNDPQKQKTDIRKNIILLSETENGQTKGKKLNNQSMKAYFTEKEDDKSKQNDTGNQYAKLNELLQMDIWEEPEKTPKYNPASIVNDNNFFKVTRQQDNEVMFSNMLFYYLSNYKTILSKFIREVLKLNYNESEKYEVFREKNRMDLRIQSGNEFIILENKIHSGINGIKTKSKSKDQNGEVDEDTTNEQQETDKDMEYDPNKGCYVDKSSKGIISQLSNYYNIALQAMNNDKTKVHCFILHPEYSQFNLDDYYCGDEYEKISYKKLHKFFSDILNEGVLDDKYLSDYVNALRKHTENTDNEFRNDMLIRLRDRIERHNKEQQ